MDGINVVENEVEMRRKLHLTKMAFSLAGTESASIMIWKFLGKFQKEWIYSTLLGGQNIKNILENYTVVYGKMLAQRKIGTNILKSNFEIIN